MDTPGDVRLPGNDQCDIVTDMQGQFDILDGPASNMAWIDELKDWPQLQEFVEQPSQLWCANDCEDVTDTATHKRETGNISGWWRSAGLLTHAVVYRAGHMVPHVSVYTPDTAILLSP
jgi:vitellogenic carboxypeptidase-like protein